jgi:hypothetical protein
MKRQLGELVWIALWGMLVVSVQFPHIGKPVMTAFYYVQIVVGVRYILLADVPPKWFGKVVRPFAIGHGATWRVSVAAVALCLVFPVILVILVTSGSSGSATIGALSHYWVRGGAVTIVEMACLVGIVIMVVTVPEFLRIRGLAWTDDSPVPGWLAAFAAVFTVGYVLVLHFDRRVLASSNLGVLSAAAFGLAVLLVPFYRVVARTCWQCGVEVVFDPVQWWLSCRAAWREVRGSLAGGVRGEAGAVGHGADGTRQSAGSS